MRLDLGGGTNNTKAPGHINIDIADIPGVDIVWDLNKGLPKNFIFRTKEGGIEFDNLGTFEPNSIEGIRCHQVVEHLDTVIPLMNDCFEVLKPGGILEISTPLAFTDAWAQDPTHKKMFVRRTFDYFCDDESTKDAREEYGITAKFKVVWELLEHGWNLQIHLQKPEDKPIPYSDENSQTPIPQPQKISVSEGVE
jgi:SAM-dependent methyltransferase